MVTLTSEPHRAKRCWVDKLSMDQEGPSLMGDSDMIAKCCYRTSLVAYSHYVRNHHHLDSANNLMKMALFTKVAT